MRNQLNKKILIFNVMGMLTLSLYLLACPRYGVVPVRKISLREYVEWYVPQVEVSEAPYPYILKIEPVTMPEYIRADYNPDNTFRRELRYELEEGAETYFRRRAIFSAVQDKDAQFSLTMRVVEYKASASVNPQKISLILEITFTNLETMKTYLFGKIGSEVLIPIRELIKPTELTPPGFGRAITVENGAIVMGQICLRIFQNLEKQALLHREQILKELK
jgi:hypothetical protein